MPSLVIKYEEEKVFSVHVEGADLEVSFQAGFAELNEMLDTDDLQNCLLNWIGMLLPVRTPAHMDAVKDAFLGATASYMAHTAMMMFNERDKAVKAAMDFAEKSGQQRKLLSLLGARYEKDKAVWLVTLRKAFSTYRLLVRVNSDMEVEGFETLEAPQDKTGSNKEES